MSLRGAVQAFPLETVLQLLADTEKTGRLDVRSDERGGALAVSSGRLVSAWSEDESGPSALGAIFTIQRGLFEFEVLDHIEGSDLTGELDELLDRAVAERDRISAIREIVPDERMRFTLSQRAAERAEIRLSADQWKALLAVDGQRDVAAIAEKLGVRRLAALDLLANLVKAGMVDASAPVADAGAGPRPFHVVALPPTATGEAVELRGSTSEFPLETILQLLAHTKKTGRVDVRSDNERATLGMKDGRLVAATSEEESGDLALGSTFAIGGARFEFVPMASAPTGNLVGDLDELLDRAAETRDRIAVIRSLVPDERARFKLSDRATRHEEIRLTSEEWRALLAVNGERDVAGIAGQLRMRRLPTMVILADLIEGGLVDVLAPPEHVAAPVAEPAFIAPAAAAAEAPAMEEPLAETPLDREPAPPPAGLPPAEPITEVPPPPPSWEAPAAEPAVPSWEEPAAEPAVPSWDVPATEAAPSWEQPVTEPEPEVDPRLAAFGAPPVAERPAEAEVPPEAEPEIDPRLAAFGAPPAAPTWEPTAPSWEAPAEPIAEAPTWAAPAAETIGQPEVIGEPEAGELVIDMTGLGEPEVATPIAAAEPAAAPAAPAAPAKKSLFGGLFGAKQQEAAVAAPPPAAAQARTRAGQLALFVNELLAGYNSGQYGKGRVEDRMTSLLMRVDEQADPIDRALPIRNDRLDVGTIDSAAIPERQALPYLAMLARQVYDDAERALGKDKAKRGFRDTRDRLFGKDVSLFQAPEVAGRVPKV